MILCLIFFFTLRCCVDWLTWQVFGFQFAMRGSSCRDRSRCDLFHARLPPAKRQRSFSIPELRVNGFGACDYDVSCRKCYPGRAVL